MPYQSLGSFVAVSSRVSECLRWNSSKTNLGVPQIDKSSLVGAVGLLQVVHHEETVSFVRELAAAA